MSKLIKRKVKQYILCKIDGCEYQPGDIYASNEQERIDYLTELGYLEGDEPQEPEDLEDLEEPEEQEEQEEQEEPTPSPHQESKRGRR